MISVAALEFAHATNAPNSIQGERNKTNNTTPNTPTAARLKVRRSLAMVRGIISVTKGSPEITTRKPGWSNLFFSACMSSIVPGPSL